VALENRECAATLKSGRTAIREAKVADEFAEVREMRDRFLKAAYRHRQLHSGYTSRDDIMRDLGLDPDVTDGADDDIYVDLAVYWKDRRCLEAVIDGYGLVKITARGIQRVEGDLEQQVTPSVTFNVTNAYGSIFGAQQHAEMNNVSFDFNTVEAELDRAEAEIEQRGGSDAAELKELLAEVRALHESGEPLDRGRLAKYLGVVQRNGWIAGPIAGTLLSILTGAS
jgi:hypothetical protein